MAVEPALGTLDDFDHFVQAAAALDMDVALDLAIQCSPDHPWVTEHPEWFYQRADGTIRYAENPPKKYEDIYPVNFDTPAWRTLWDALLEVVQFWVAHGVKVFRVDNPHTKPIGFWAWLIESVQRDSPEVIFLAEAFTRPPMMLALGRRGFTQSYTYFTWRNTKTELTEYMTALTAPESASAFRPNFFANTPDILPPLLQTGNRAAFKLRLLLAALLSPSYGIYSGYELCEHAALPGREEYLDSEKYEIRPRQWDYPLGATWDGIGVNFALFSEHATPSSCACSTRPTPARNRAHPAAEQTDQVWHGYLPGTCRRASSTAIRVDGPYEPAGTPLQPHKLLLDPYAKAVGRNVRWHDSMFGFPIGDPARPCRSTTATTRRTRRWRRSSIRRSRGATTAAATRRGTRR
jgi:hypothetical protein